MATKKQSTQHHNILIGLLTVLLLIQGAYMYGNDILSLFGAATATSSVAVTNSLPVASGSQLNSGADIGPSPGNASTRISATATITDDNGCDDITGVNMSMRLSNITDPANLNPNLKNNQSYYINESCTASGCTAGGSDLTATYTCSFETAHYITPTDAGSNYSTSVWNLTVVPWDSDGRGTAHSTTQEVQTQRSFDSGASVNFTSLALGANTGATNYNITIYNTGNEQIDMSVDGYGDIDGDGVSMTCDLANISLERLKYSNQSFTYNVFNNVSSGINLTDAATQLEFNLRSGDEANMGPRREIAFGMGLPATGVSGGCSGTIQLTAAADPTGD